MNKFFDNIYIINLFDKVERWEKVSKQFKNRHIDVDRFVAVDGRCKDQGEDGCIAKKKTFETIYNVKISNKRDLLERELIPAASLTIGTILILRNMVKQKMNHILICEDDIELSYGFEKKFKQGIDELKKTKYKNKWDLLYLGCGNKCGNSDISYEKHGQVKNLSTMSHFIGDEIYVKHKNDIRMPCDDGCKNITDHISIADNAGGSWCYAFSLKGAKKILKLIDNDAGNHVDHIYQSLDSHGGIISLAFNPPIVWHEEGMIRSDTDIPWEF